MNEFLHSPAAAATKLVAAIMFVAFILSGCRGLGVSPSTTSTSTSASPTPTPQPKDVTAISHVVLMLQENRSFDSYFGMLNPYRKANNMNVGDDGKEYDVDGLADINGNLYPKANITNTNDEGTTYAPFKFKSTCIDDMSSAWLESYGDVNRYDFSPNRVNNIGMNGFVHTAEGYAKSNAGSGQFTDTAGQRAMGYYDQGFLNYYYFMASDFALSDRWFSPVSSKSISNRIATFSGGTTQGLVRDPGSDDHLPQLDIETIFQELDNAHVSWKIYYTVTQDQCLASDDGCSSGNPNKYPATDFTAFSYSSKYVYKNNGAACTGTTQPSGTAVGDPQNSFCIDVNHIAPLSHYLTDVQNGTLPSFAFIEAGYSNNDEHPGSGQSILSGQAQVASLINALMNSPSWSSSVFFLAYDEGGGPFDHVPPVANHTNDFTDPSLGITTDIASIDVNPDQYFPCLAPSTGATTHCDLQSTDPGASPSDAPSSEGFAAQLGFRIPNMVISPFTRKHYVSHVPMDHTAVIKFVESRFIGPNASLTPRDAAQPNLLDFFDFTNEPWKAPPTPPTPNAVGSSCTPNSM